MLMAGACKIFPISLIILAKANADSFISILIANIDSQTMTHYMVDVFVCLSVYLSICASHRLQKIKEARCFRGA